MAQQTRVFASVPEIYRDRDRRRQALPVKYREMVMTAILVFMGRREGAEAHLKRAIEHGATKRECLKPPSRRGARRRDNRRTVDANPHSVDREGAFKNG